MYSLNDTYFKGLRFRMKRFIYYRFVRTLVKKKKKINKVRKKC